jgi:hypothetical protein
MLTQASDLFKKLGMKQPLMTPAPVKSEEEIIAEALEAEDEEQ